MATESVDEMKLTDFDELGLEIADALGYRDKLPLDKNLFDGGCLCHTYPKDSDRSCGNHSLIIHQIRQVKKLIDAYYTRECAKKVLEGNVKYVTDWLNWVRSGGGHITRTQLEESLAELRAAIKEAGGGK